MGLFLLKVFGVLIISLLGIVTIPNPLQYQFPHYIKSYIDFQNQKAVSTDQADITAANENPLFCTQSSDCTLQLCGKAPNCHSLPLNKTYLEENGAVLPENLQCPNENTPVSPCSPEYYFDAYATCTNHSCVMNRLLHPTPTPEVHILEQ